MSGFSEKTAIEDYIVNELEKKGWRFVPADKLERESYDEPLLVGNLIRALEKHNADTGIGDEEIKHVLNELKLKGTGQEGHKAILNFYKYGVPVKFEKERVVKYVKLFDYENIGANEFIVTRQAIYHGREDIRTDIMLYINGIPLANIECKNPASFSETWYDAYQQIKDYEGFVSELYKYVEIGVAAEQVARYFPIVPWQEDVRYNQWREKGLDSVDSTIEMLSPAKLLDIIQYYLFYRVERGNATKVITRYMQYRASEKIVDRVVKNLEGVEDKNKGLIWHWQGSGKTLTMIFAANKLYHLKMLENPSIFFIVDRIELESQLYQEFYSLDIVEPEIIGSIGELRAVIEHDEGSGKRGIMITLIHKFRVEELQSLQQELEELSNVRDTIITRKNVVAFVDEGHRTQYGTLAAQMKNLLQGAFFFALTGTPISKKGRDTYLEFSYPPEERYLDRYFITDSIEDGFTKRIVYQPRLEKELHLEKETLTTLLDILDEENLDELPEDAKEKVKGKVGERLSAVKLILENPEWIKRKAEDIAEHFKENVDGKFKALVVAASRKACAVYKEELDLHLPKEYSEIVMTIERGDKGPIQSYVREARARYGGREITDIRKDVIEKFKEEEYPKILIVTDMLLTGFDAPILQTMYLDKPLREHRLLQAIARTNRPYKDFKEAGLIIDYIGQLKEFKRAFEMYQEKEIQGALFNRDEIRVEFIEKLNELLQLFKDIPKDQYDRGVLIKAVEILTTDEEKGKNFQEDYRALRKLFELLSSDIIKADPRIFSDYKWISAIYVYYMKTVLRREPSYERYVQKYFDKTVKYVHKTTELEKLEKELPIIRFDENYLKRLEAEIDSKEEKAANIVFALNRLVLVEKHKNPVYISLVDKVEGILELWKEKTKDFEKIYSEGVAALDEIQKLTRRQKELAFNNLEYSQLLALEKRFGKDKELIKDVKELSENLRKQMFPGWVMQSTARKKVERELRRFVRRYVKRYDLTLQDIDELYKQLIESVKNYGTAS